MGDHILYLQKQKVKLYVDIMMCSLRKGSCTVRTICLILFYFSLCLVVFKYSFLTNYLSQIYKILKQNEKQCLETSYKKLIQEKRLVYDKKKK